MRASGSANRRERRSGVFQENISDVACGDQKDVLSREFHRGTKSPDVILEYHETASA